MAVHQRDLASAVCQIGTRLVMKAADWPTAKASRTKPGWLTSRPSRRAACAAALVATRRHILTFFGLSSRCSKCLLRC